MIDFLLVNVSKVRTVQTLLRTILYGAVQSHIRHLQGTQQCPGTRRHFVYLDERRSLQLQLIPPIFR